MEPTPSQTLRADITTARALDLTRAQAQALIKAGRVLTNGVPVGKTSQPLPLDTEITLQPEPEKEPIILPDLEVLFEDNFIIVASKPSGLVIHQTTPDEVDTLAARLWQHYPAAKDATIDSSTTSEQRAGIVHRLDKDTSGVVILAKTSEALQKLQEQFKAHSITKSYRAIAFGTIKKEECLVTNIVRNGRSDKNMFKVSTTNAGREAVTSFHPLWHESHDSMPFSYLSVQIATGRTHQIRVHLKHLGSPLLGDSLYATKASLDASKHLGINRQMLHAHSISFTHPITGKLLEFTSPLPQDMRDILTAIGVPDSLSA